MAAKTSRPLPKAAQLNAADAITRGSKVKVICGKSDWLEGPEFMKDAVEE